MPYSNALDVRQSAGVKPQDLGFSTEPELDSWIETRLAEISDLIDQHIAELFQGSAAPPGVHGIARQMAVNLVANTIATRQAPVVRISDWNVRVQQAAVFTDDIKTSLRIYRTRSTINIFRVPRHPESVS